MSIENQNTLNYGMSSHQIASVLGKRHKHVKRDIQQLIDEGALKEHDFELVEFIDTKDRPKIGYYLENTALWTLITDYTDVLAIARYLKANPASSPDTSYGLVSDNGAETPEQPCSCQQGTTQSLEAILEELHVLRSMRKSHDLQVEAFWEALGQERSENRDLLSKAKKVQSERDSYKLALEASTTLLVERNDEIENLHREIADLKKGAEEDEA